MLLWLLQRCPARSSGAGPASKPCPCRWRAAAPSSRQHSTQVRASTCMLSLSSRFHCQAKTEARQRCAKHREARRPSLRRTWLLPPCLWPATQPWSRELHPGMQQQVPSASK